jgi:hypothetical protein
MCNCNCKEKTDLEKFIELYKSVGIELKPSNKSNSGDSSADEYPDSVYLSLVEGINEKIHGYTLFYTELEFTKEGKFIRQGIWE